jgi:hypothetical protein
VEGTLTPLETAKLGLLAAGAATMLYALRPAAQISRELPAGAIRRLWALLRGMIFLFAAGHVLYFVAAIRGRVAIDSFVAITYFLGSCFVLIVCWTAVRTVATVQRVATLRAETTTDDLMGIHNRRYLEKHLLEDVAKTQRYGWPFSVLMLDLDHFKRINDEGGHAAGDAVLRGFGRILRESVRVSDVAAEGRSASSCSPTRRQKARQPSPSGCGPRSSAKTSLPASSPRRRAPCAARSASGWLP